MKATIEVTVKNRREADAIQRAVKDRSVLAFLKVVGALEPLSERARIRVLNYVRDQLKEDNAAQ